MTKINKVTIHGFKSFAHKTEIPFEESYNCVLGPNGSGKSNIGDALCFVLGRLSAKSMRAEKAANLIFNGGKNKSPSKQGSVEITFCNETKTFPYDTKEVAVSRVISPKGSSSYRINGKKKTRTEVLDTLGLAKINPEGYNIILQGDITRFVTMSPTERRKIIEEISDVSTYDEKKNKALNELNRVDEKLTNAKIILKERSTYLRELKKDRDQALRFKGIKDNIDSHKATFLHLQIQEKEKEKSTQDQTINKHQTLVDQSQKKIEEVKASIETKRNEVTALNKEIEQKGEKEQVKIHQEVQDLNVKIAEDKTRLSTLKDEINKIQLRKDQFQQEIKDIQKRTTNFSSEEKQLRQNISQKNKEIAHLTKSITDFKKKHKIETSHELEKDLAEKDKAIDQKQEEVQVIRQKQQELLRDKDKIEYQLQTIDERISKVKSVAKEHKDQLTNLKTLKDQFKTATLKLNKCLDTDASFAAQVGHARQKLNSLQEKHATLNAKTISRQMVVESNQAVQSILKQKTKFRGVYGTIAQLAQVKKAHSQALESAAGGKMHNIVVKDDQTAADCIKYLKSNKLGSASFIPLNKIRFQEVNGEDRKFSKKAGVSGFAVDLVSFDGKFKKAFQYVFGKTLVVDDLETAREIGIGKIRMATLDGNIAEGSGVMRGGFFGRSKASFQEKDSLNELKAAEAEISQLQSVLSKVTTQREANEQEITSLRQLKAGLEGELIKLEKSLHLDSGDLEATQGLKKELSEQMKQVDQQLNQIRVQISGVNKDLAGLKSKKQMLRSEVMQLRNPRLLAQLKAFEESHQQARESLVRLEGDLKSKTSQMYDLIRPEEEKIQSIIKQHDKEEAGFKIEIANLTKALKNNSGTLKTKEEASKKFQSKYHALFGQREKLGQTITKLENQAEKTREESRSSERELNLNSLKNAEIKAKLAGLNEEFQKYKDASLLKGRNIQELQKEISKYEVMLAQMSAVNMKALEVYEQVEKEFTKLVDKRESLITEKTDVHTLINEIETKKKEHFMKTFKAADKNFREIFCTLFKKGKAYLELGKPSAPFDEGLNIKVKLSGNRFMDLKSLSGGEKTLTALSFIFAIQEYQPATFYILDEIDAALDKHNSEKLAKLIRNYSRGAQYIVISHNDSIISESDTLFGVSMTDGVSKITSLKI